MMNRRTFFRSAQRGVLCLFIGSWLFSGIASAARDLRFDYALFCCGCSGSSFCQTHFDHLNFVSANGHYLATTTDNHISETTANGNALCAYWNDLNTGWTTTPATQQADDIDAWVQANFNSPGPPPTWLQLNEISAGTWPGNQTYRTWVHDVCDRLTNTYGYNVILFSPFSNPAANDADWQAVSQVAYIGIECYLSGEEVKAQNFSVSWCQSQYQSSKTSYLNRGVPASKIMVAEHFSQTLSGTGWGRAGISYSDWDKVIIARSTAIENVGFAGFISYAWRGNAMGVSDEDMYHFMDTYASMGLPNAYSQAASYTWVGGNGVYETAGNWSPARTTPAITDILVFDGSVSGQSAPAITISGNDTISQLRVIQQASVTFNPTASSIITCQSTGAFGSGNEAVQIGAGTSLNLAGTTANAPIIIALTSASRGVVDGNVWFDNGTASGYNRMASLQAGGLVFRAGSNCYVGGAAAPAGGCFGQNAGAAATTSVNGGVVFNAGAEYHHQLNPDGSRATAAYPFPHQLTSPNSMVTFESGSNFLFWANNAAGFSGRSFADLTLKSNATVTVSAPTSLGNLYIQNNGTGTQHTVTLQGSSNSTIYGGITVDSDSGGLRLGGTGTRNISVAGDISIGGSSLLANSTSNDILVLNGTAAQTADFGGATVQKLQINNSAGVAMTSALSVSTLLDLASGQLDTNGHTLTTPDLTGLTRTDGFVSGTLTRSINLSTVGTRSFPVGKSSYAGVDLVINNAGTGSGTLAVSTTDGDPPGVSSPSSVLDRYWTLTDTGSLDLSGTNTQLRFHYLQSDVSGTVNESTLVVARKPTAGSWQQMMPSTRDTANNVVTVDNVTGFSTWTLAAPGALPVTLISFSAE